MTPRLALVLIDVINPFRLAGADALFAQALPTAERIAALQTRLKGASVPSIYVNDAFREESDGSTSTAAPTLESAVAYCRRASPRARAMLQHVNPVANADHFIPKTKHSGFFRTELEVLLDRLEVNTVVLVGIAGDICVSFTANDAYMRGFRVCVPSDCVASERAPDNAHALSQMQRVLAADIRPSYLIRA